MIYHNDIITRDKLRFRIRFEPDEDHEPPWEDGDGQGIVSQWTTRNKLPGERVLHTDRSAKRYFDWKGTVAKAKLEGWGLCDEEKAKLGVKLGRAPTAKEITEAAVEANFEWMRRWCNDDWHYVGIVIERLSNVGAEDDEGTVVDSCWGFEDSDPHLQNEAESMLNYVAEQVQKEEDERSIKSDDLWDEVRA